MIFEYATLKMIWWVLTGVLMIGFAVTGGMDIGAHILLPIVGKTNDDRRLILNAVGPTWEGNQVWLVTFGATLFAIWPSVYAASFTIFYPALLIAVLMLILRPPGFDYRSKLDSLVWRNTWDYCLFASGIILPLIFGVAIGNLFLGLPFYIDQDMRLIYDGSLFSPITIVFGLISLTMFAVQGGIYLQYKLDGELATRAKLAVKKFGLVFIFSFITAGCYQAFDPSIYKVGGWLLNYTNMQQLWILPGATVLFSIIAIILSHYSWAATALFCNSLSITGAICTAAATLYPFILPSSAKPEHSFTIWGASSSHLTLSYTLWVVVLLLPIVLLYTSWVYRVMRGKVKMQTNSY